jgi:hypothetical protein
MANGIAFAAPLPKSPQAIDASAPSDAGIGFVMSLKQRQQRQGVCFGTA